MKDFNHISVLLEEAVDSLVVKAGGRYVDATAGGGGHLQRIVDMGGVVLGIDQDDDALAHLKTKFEGKEVTLAKGNFRDIETISRNEGFDLVNGVLMDLGVSSYQIDASERGFSIRKNERLDMRMNPQAALSAYEVVNSYPKQTLVEIFYKYGEEHNARRIADAIVEQRKKKDIETTGELKDLVERIPHKSEAIHPATRIFQAIRIEVNDELNAIQEGIEGAFNILNKNGRLVVISFHSLEDRIIKRTFEKWSREQKGMVITKKPLTPTGEEIMRNKRSRSAKMRIIEKL